MAASKQETPGFSKAAEVASLLDITIQRVGQLRKEGVLKQYKTPAGDRYKLVEAVKDYIRFIRDREPKDSRGSPDESRKVTAEADLKESKASMAKLQLQELEGKMHRSEDVEAMTTNLVYTIRSMIMALPGRMAVDMANIKTAPEASIRIEQECHEILRELAAYKYDPEKYKQRVRDREGWQAVDGQDDEE